MSSNKAKIFLIVISLLLMSLQPSCADRGTRGTPFVDNGLLIIETVDVMTGERISFSELLKEDRAVFMNFWGVKCLSCLEEIKELNRLYEGRLKGGRVEFIAVNSDGIDAEALRESMEENDIHIEFAVVADPDRVITDYYTNGFIPHNVIITKDGGREIEIIGFNKNLFYRLRNKLIELAEGDGRGKHY